MVGLDLLVPTGGLVRSFPKEPRLGDDTRLHKNLKSRPATQLLPLVRAFPVSSSSFHQAILLAYKSFCRLLIEEPQISVEIAGGGICQLDIHDPHRLTRQ